MELAEPRAKCYPQVRMANPVFTKKAFEGNATVADAMTVNGTIGKSSFLALIALVSAAWAWNAPDTGRLAMGGTLLGFVLAMIICFKPMTAPYLSSIYAVAEGVALGAISTIFEAKYQGLVVQALLVTAGVFCGMLGLYLLRIVRASAKLVATVFAATAGIALLYLVNFVLGFFGTGLPFLNGSGPVALAVSGVICLIAAFNLIVDFGFIEEGVRNQAPKYFEWYCAFGLMVTVVWLYLELLRFLSKLSSRR